MKRGDVKCLSSGSGFFKTKQQTQKEEHHVRGGSSPRTYSPELVSTLRSRFRTSHKHLTTSSKRNRFRTSSFTLTELGEVDLPRLWIWPRPSKLRREYSKVSEDEFLHLCRLIKRDGIHGLAGG